MAKINFTAARVDAHHCPPGQFTEKGNPVTQAFLWDSKTPGLGLRATIAGAKSYIFQGKIHGQTVRLTIGDPRSWTISKAQEEARRLQTLIDSGQDPREVKEEQRASYEARQVAALRESATVSQAWADYLSDLRTKISPKTKQPRSATYINDHIKLAAPGGTPTKRGSKQTERGPLYPLMGLKLSELTTKTICTWLESEVPSRPTSAAYAFRMLKAFVRWCEGHDKYAGIAAADCCTSPKVTGILPRNNTKDGDSLQREQLAAWFYGGTESAQPSSIRLFAGAVDYRRPTRRIGSPPVGRCGFPMAKPAYRRQDRDGSWPRHPAHALLGKPAAQSEAPQ